MILQILLCFYGLPEAFQRKRSQISQSRFDEQDPEHEDNVLSYQRQHGQPNSG